MHTPDKMDPKVSGVYKEIVRPSRLLVTSTWAHETQETLVSVTFKAVGKDTGMPRQHTNMKIAERRARHSHGWTDSYAQLAAVLARTRLTE